MHFQRLIDLLISQQASVDTMGRFLGQLRETRPGDGYFYAPPPQEHVRAAKLGVHPTVSGKELLASLELEFEPAFCPPLSELERIYGKGVRVPPAPDGIPYQALFVYKKPNQDYMANIYAELAEPPNNNKARVLKLVAMRQERPR